MPTLLQRFLANAQRALIPSAVQSQGIDSLLSSVVPTIETDQQSRPIEFDFLSATNVALAQRIFTIARQVPDSIALYHHFALSFSATPPGPSAWTIGVQYPGIPIEYVVSRAANDDLDNNPLTGNPAGGDYIRKVQRADATVDRDFTLQFQPFKVWPGGVVRMYSSAQLAIGFTTILSYMRELFGIPADQSIRTGSLTATEV